MALLSSTTHKCEENPCRPPSASEQTPNTFVNLSFYQLPQWLAMAGQCGRNPVRVAKGIRRTHVLLHRPHGFFQGADG